MADLEHGTFTPMSYLKIFFRRKEVFIVPVFIGLIVGICTGILMPKQYRSSTVILVEEGKSDNPLFQNIAVSSTISQRLSNIKETMLGWNNLVQLVKRLNLDKDVKTVEEFENLILGIRNDIQIMPRGRNIIELSYVGEQPEQTQAIVKNITEIFIEKNVNAQNQETSDAIAFIEEQLHLYRGKIKSAEIAHLQEELDFLLLDSTEMHPRVKQLRELIGAKRGDLAKENLEYNEDVVLDAKTTNPIIEEIKRALENLEGKGKGNRTISANPQEDVYKVMLIDKLDKVMARDVGVNTSIYNMLLQRLETAKITQRLQSSKEGTKYTILDPPRIPLKPFKPNKLLVAFLGLVGGAALGAGLVFSFEFFDKSFLDVEEAKEFLGVPLLGAISKIHTVDSVRHDREKQRWIYSLTMIVGIITVIVTVVVAEFLK